MNWGPHELSYLAIILLSYQESNLDLQSQNLSCCHYTIAQWNRSAKVYNFWKIQKFFAQTDYADRQGLFPDDLYFVVQAELDDGGCLAGGVLLAGRIDCEVHCGLDVLGDFHIFFRGRSA